MNVKINGQHVSGANYITHWVIAGVQYLVIESDTPLPLTGTVFIEIIDRPDAYWCNAVVFKDWDEHDESTEFEVVGNLYHEGCTCGAFER